MSSWALEPPSQPPCAGKVELRRVRRVRGDGEEEESGSRAAFCSPDSVLDDPQSRLAQGGGSEPPAASTRANRNRSRGADGLCEVGEEQGSVGVGGEGKKKKRV
jgi:hypothetical protein